jgi:WD40 repeat protein
MNKNLITTNQNAKLVLEKTKKLLDISNNLISKNNNNDLVKSFQFKPYLLDTLNCSVKSVAVTPDGKTIMSVSADNTIKLWDIKSGEHINTLDRQESVISSLAITPDGKFIIIGSERGTIDLCEIKTGKAIGTFNNSFNCGSINSLEVSSNGKYFVSINDFNYEELPCGQEDYETLTIWDIESRQVIHHCKAHIGATTVNEEYLVSSISYYDYSNYYIENISISDIKSGNIIDWLDGYVQKHSTKVSSLAITPDGSTIVSGGGDEKNTIYLLCQDNTYLEVSDSTKTIKLWDVAKSSYIKVLEGHTDTVNSIIIMQDGKNIVSGSKDKNIKIWDIQSGECIRTLEGHEDSVNSVIITQDEKNIVSKSYDKTIKVWDIQSGKCNYTIYNIKDGSTVTIFSDGYFNASEQNIDKFIRIDDISTTCRKLTKKEIEHFCKVKHKNESHLSEIDIDDDETVLG